MALRGKLRRLEREAEGETMVLVLQDTGEQMRVPFDAPVRWLVAEWTKGTGGAVEPDPVVERLAALMERGVREKHPDLDGRILSGVDDARRAKAGT